MSLFLLRSLSLSLSFSPSLCRSVSLSRCLSVFPFGRSLCRSVRRSARRPPFLASLFLPRSLSSSLCLSLPLPASLFLSLPLSLSLVLSLPPFPSGLPHTLPLLLALPECVHTPLTAGARECDSPSERKASVGANTHGFAHTAVLTGSSAASALRKGQSYPATPAGSQHSCQPTVKLHILPLVWNFPLRAGWCGVAGCSS